MNCYYHPQHPAVAQCAGCGKGLCTECASRNTKKVPLCPSCAKKSLEKSIRAGIVYFVVLGLTYYVGRTIGLNTNNHDASWGWMFVSVWTGLSLMSGKFEVPLLVSLLSPTAGCALNAVKLILAIVIGALLWIPIALWQLFCLVRNICRLRSWQKVDAD